MSLAYFRNVPEIIKAISYLPYYYQQKDVLDALVNMGDSGPDFMKDSMEFMVFSMEVASHRT
jgi:hypothetical protein